MTGRESGSRVADPLFLLDTDICIYALKALFPPLRRRIESFEPGQVVTSSIAYAEVMKGLASEGEERRCRAEAFFNVVEVLPFDRAAASAYALIPFKRASFDRLIAAHALAASLTLITNNEKDFRGVEGLIVQNWTEQ